MLYTIWSKEYNLSCLSGPQWRHGFLVYNKDKSLSLPLRVDLNRLVNHLDKKLLPENCLFEKN